jgi:pimeloyl-[acyl-carrier protein] methyl ester esterase
VAARRRIFPVMMRYKVSMGVVEDIAIVLLPGMDGTGELLAPLANQLSMQRSVQVIAYPNDRPLAYRDLVAFVIERAPKQRFVVLGESFSGPIAIEVAASDNRVAGLVLASSFARHPMPAMLRPLASIFDVTLMPARLVAAALLGSAGTPDLKARFIQVLAKVPREIIRARALDVLGVDKRDRLRDVECPLLYLHGRFDWLVRKKCLDEIRSIQPKCQVRRFDASHMLLETHTDAAAEAINQFCDQLH